MHRSMHTSSLCIVAYRGIQLHIETLLQKVQDAIHASLVNFKVFVKLKDAFKLLSNTFAIISYIAPYTTNCSNFSVAVFPLGAVLRCYLLSLSPNNG